MILPILVVAPSDKQGRGVFASEKITEGTLIEISPVLVFSAKDRKQVEKTMLFDYIFEWGRKRKKACIALGYLSLYNHAYDANCEYEMDYATELISPHSVLIQKNLSCVNRSVPSGRRVRRISLM